MDTLIIAEAVPHMWLGAPYRVGNSAIVIDDVAYLKRAIELFINSIVKRGF